MRRSRGPRRRRLATQEPMAPPTCMIGPSRPPAPPVERVRKVAAGRSQSTRRRILPSCRWKAAIASFPPPPRISGAKRERRPQPRPHRPGRSTSGQGRSSPPPPPMIRSPCARSGSQPARTSRRNHCPYSRTAKNAAPTRPAARPTIAAWPSVRPTRRRSSGALSAATRERRPSRDSTSQSLICAARRRMRRGDRGFIDGNRPSTSSAGVGRGGSRFYLLRGRSVQGLGLARLEGDLHPRNPPLIGGANGEDEVAVADLLARPGNVADHRGDEAADRLVIAFLGKFQVPVLEVLVDVVLQVADRDPALDLEDAVLEEADRLAFLPIALVADLADDLLDHVLDRDEAGRSPELVHRHRDLQP